MSLRTLGLAGGDRIAVLRAVGAISRGKAMSGMGGVKSDSFIEKIRMVKGEVAGGRGRSGRV